MNGETIAVKSANFKEQQRIALDLLQRGSFADAECILAGLLREEQTSERWNDWATSQVACGDLDKVEAGFREALKLDSHNSQALVNLGVVFAKRGRAAEGLGWLERGADGVDEAQRRQVIQLQTACKDMLAIFQAQPVGPAVHFLDYHRNHSLGEIFADQTPVSIDDPGLRWLRPPSPSLLAYCQNRRSFPFDGVPPDRNSFLKDPTFCMTQVHRLALTLDALCRNWPLGRRGPILDLGAFPFTLDIAIREYLGFPNPILATVNQQIPEEWRAILEEFDISPVPTNLDPYVQNTEEPVGIKDYVQADSGSVEFVIFAHVIEHLYHPARLLKEAHRVLRKGGKMLLSTDNAFLLSGLINYLTFGEYVHEPVQGTAAMTFTTWRGHVRFFTASDLRTLLTSAGFKIVDAQFHEVLYNSFLPEYFRHPTTSIPRWRADLLTTFPHYRNEIILVAEKT